MATLRDIRNRIKSIKNTQQITKAMKMVSAAKLRRVQEMALANRDYHAQLVAVTRNLALLAGPGAHPLFRPRDERKIDLILFSSDKGLCGSFNSSLIKQAVTFVRQHPESEVTMLPVGKKGRDYCHLHRWPTAAEYADIYRSIGLPLAKEIAATALGRLEAGEADATYIVFSRFISVMNQKPTVLKLFPIPPADPGDLPPVEYLYEPGREEIIRTIIPLFTDITVYQGLIETAASEHGARMTAMDTATKNAGELIARLTLFYNRARQAAITTELNEVVSGAEALEG